MELGKLRESIWVAGSVLPTAGVPKKFPSPADEIPFPKQLQSASERQPTTFFLSDLGQMIRR
jgi:hypothetical protein